MSNNTRDVLLWLISATLAGVSLVVTGNPELLFIAAAPLALIIIRALLGALFG